MAARIAICAFAYLVATIEAPDSDRTIFWVLAGFYLAFGGFWKRPNYATVRVGRWMMAPALAALIAISVVVSLIVTGHAPDSGPTILSIAAVCFLAGLAVLLLILPQE